MVKRQKTKAIIAKRYKNKRRISLFSREKKNYESKTIDDTNLDQANNKYCNRKNITSN